MLKKYYDDYHIQVLPYFYPFSLLILEELGGGMFSDEKLYCSCPLLLVWAVTTQCIDPWVMVHWRSLWVSSSQAGYSLSQSVQSSHVNPDSCPDITVGISQAVSYVNVSKHLYLMSSWVVIMWNIVVGLSMLVSDLYGFRWNLVHLLVTPLGQWQCLICFIVVCLWLLQITKNHLVVSWTW